MMIMMRQIAFIDLMGHFSLPKQLDNAITRKVRIKETYQVQYHTITKKTEARTTQTQIYHLQFPPSTFHSLKCHPHLTSSFSSPFTDWNGLGLSVIMNSKSYDSDSLCF